MLTVCNFCKDPFYNQAFEEFIFQTFLEDDIFFLWQNVTSVVVGSYQNICREVHVETLRKLGIPMVRRMSGGGTVYHDLGNVNYTYITQQDGPLDYDRPRFLLSPVRRRVLGQLERLLLRSGGGHLPALRRQMAGQQQLSADAGMQRHRLPAVSSAGAGGPGE